MLEPPTMLRPDPVPDEHLAELWGRGDRTAPTELYRRYGQRIFKFLVVRTQSLQDAEELNQVVWEKADRAIVNFRPETGTFRAWLYKIADNARKDLFRSALMKLRRLTDPDPETLLTVPAVEEVGDPAFARKVKQALPSLSKNQRTTLIMTADGLSDSEIAMALDCSPDTVRSHRRRGREKLEKITGGAP